MKFSSKSEYLEVMNVYDIYSANSIEKIVDTINHLHKNLTKMKTC